MKKKIIFCLAMVIWGTIGPIRRMIPLSSSIVALFRAGIGSLVLLFTMILIKHRINFKMIRNNLLYLIPSGILLGFNWILLFEAYNYTTIAIGTLCYYMAPIFVILCSPFVFKEKLTLKKMICTLVALLGMVFVSGILTSTMMINKGILYGLASALFYASIMILNKKIKEVDALDKTLIQLVISTVVLIPYILISEDLLAIPFTSNTILYLLIAGIIHTGLAYVMYFGTIAELPGLSAALFSYLDPVVAIFISFLFLHEPIDTFGIIGAFLILGSAIYSEIK